MKLVEPARERQRTAESKPLLASGDQARPQDPDHPRHGFDTTRSQSEQAGSTSFDTTGPAPRTPTSTHDAAHPTAQHTSRSCCCAHPLRPPRRASAIRAREGQGEVKGVGVLWSGLFLNHWMVSTRAAPSSQPGSTSFGIGGQPALGWDLTCGRGPRFRGGGGPGPVPRGWLPRAPGARSAPPPRNAAPGRPRRRPRRPRPVRRGTRTVCGG